MELMDQNVEVTSGYYKGIKGIVTGSTVDGFYLVMPETNNGFWATADELSILQTGS